MALTAVPIVPVSEAWRTLPELYSPECLEKLSDKSLKGSQRAGPVRARPLLGVFSLVTLFAHQRMMQSMGVVRRAAWYLKTRPTFSDALALVRKELWAHATFRRSLADTDTLKVPRAFVEQLTETLCYAA